MKQKLTPRWLVIKLAGILFAAYSAYNIFILYRNGSTLPEQGVFITALVAALFGLLAVFAWIGDGAFINCIVLSRISIPQSRIRSCMEPHIL